MKILVAGAQGQLATALSRLGNIGELHLQAFGRPQLDLCDRDLIRAVVAKVRPDLIINAAAWTHVDRAEEAPDDAMLLNATGAEWLAESAAEAACPIIHVSTDYVFDGMQTTPYVESDATAPLNSYGRSKLAGELAVASATARHVILRTSWVYGPDGANFMKTMLRVAQTRDEIAVVDDQFGAPTPAAEIAKGILQIAAALGAKSDDSMRMGVFHMVCGGACSWADFAEAIFIESARFGGPVADVRRIPSVEYPTPSARPMSSRLDCSKIEREWGVKLPHWRDCVASCVEATLREMEGSGEPNAGAAG